MNEKRRFEYLEHTADAYIAAYGKDLAEAFESAALAMFEVMTDVGKVTPAIEDTVKVDATDEYALLYSWLEALLVKFDIKSFLCSKVNVLKLEESPLGFCIEAKIWGEKFDPRKHLQKVGVKAVTYHRMEITKEPGETTLRFILDI